ncbi:MAG: Cytochrome c class I [uncultured Sulfurovum sp.]|uniref:Cytochrome c class I n=1 Tax=uncultured Sulfurovum sp. TaxID=269237 RepID=A0A6S6TNL8_9BACT|nr:MAG: Cytochrome c class I [uncultured Sulfurovum sp.]
MKLKKTIVILGALFLLTPSVYGETSGETLFKAKCAACHVKTRPSDISALVAPPAMGVMRHVKMRYSSKEEAVKFIVDYALNPEESKAVCMPDKIKRFGLMPSQKGNVTQAELQTIASWMYDNFGSLGQGQGHGQQCKNR